MADVSIIIPTLNTNGMYDQLLKNIRECGFKVNYEIIPVLNMKVNEAWNHGVEQATGKYVMIINDDILFEKKSLSEMFEVAQEGDEKVVYCPYFTLGADPFRGNVYSTENNICGFCFMMEKKYWEPIDERIKIWYGDNRIYQYMNKNVRWFPEVIIHHFGSTTINNHPNKMDIKADIDSDAKMRKIIKEEREWID